jgi:hypothetical protein
MGKSRFGETELWNLLLKDVKKREESKTALCLGL